MRYIGEIIIKCAAYSRQAVRFALPVQCCKLRCEDVWRDGAVASSRAKCRTSGQLPQQLYCAVTQDRAAAHMASWCAS